MIADQSDKTWVLVARPVWNSKSQFEFRACMSCAILCAMQCASVMVCAMQCAILSDKSETLKDKITRLEAHFRCRQIEQRLIIWSNLKENTRTCGLAR